MSDITANVVVSMPSQLFTMARSFKAVANGKIYIGKIDTDPVNSENQIQVYVENEDGSHVPVSQPIIINAAGYPVYNGQIAKFVTVQGHSMAVYDAYGSQQFYFPNVLKYDPDMLKRELQSDTLTGLVNDHVVFVKQPHDGSITTTQHDKNEEIISITDFGAIPGTDCSAAFNSAIQAIKSDSSKTKKIYVPGNNLPYYISNIEIDSVVCIYGDSKKLSVIEPLKNGDACFILLKGSEFSRFYGLNITSKYGKSGSNCVGFLIKSPLITIEECSFSFLNSCIYSPSGYSAAELDIRHNRFAASSWGIRFEGGQINSRMLMNTYSDCYSGFYARCEKKDVSTITEGLKLHGELFYSCGYEDAGLSAIDIDGVAWTWLIDVMSDLATGPALRVKDSKQATLVGGYFSSNSSTSSCAIIEGSSDMFTAVGSTFSDSRKWGVEITKNIFSPSNVTLNNCIIQNNNLVDEQIGDLLVNSVTNVRVINCTLTSGRVADISIFDNAGGGASAYLYNTVINGGASVGPTNCRLINNDSPSHPDKQTGIIIIPDGSASVQIPLTIKSIQNTSSIGVIATSTDVATNISAGVVDNTIKIVRDNTSGEVACSFFAYLIQ
ncbi:TPA: phage head-binding domain-containing protein [Escherichia coli]|uniref:phage head-binding domain-containing protein n=1 Tax=Escherichia coli TaxID=562 RepID=UPI00168CD4A7|nr:phage head-binding domain-containing protein [Escherichia coli]MBW2787795.1 phage head-binding domain-containing protein [Escherichia coli]QOD31907.1 phage head-binding domain-containing protein [Escherichia coli O19:H7]HEA3501607.1 phage head-binding domain-containing protein [Escherichia coli]HEA3607287.1 phage head-binding domain-containing protein [Escherichia coli]